MAAQLSGLFSLFYTKQTSKIRGVIRSIPFVRKLKRRRKGKRASHDLEKADSSGPFAVEGQSERKGHERADVEGRVSRKTHINSQNAGPVTVLPPYPTLRFQSSKPINLIDTSTVPTTIYRSRPPIPIRRSSCRSVRRARTMESLSTPVPSLSTPFETRQEVDVILLQSLVNSWRTLFWAPLPTSLINESEREGIRISLDVQTLSLLLQTCSTEPYIRQAALAVGMIMQNVQFSGTLPIRNTKKTPDTELDAVKRLTTRHSSAVLRIWRARLDEPYYSLSADPQIWKVAFLLRYHLYIAIEWAFRETEMEGKDSYRAVLKGEWRREVSRTGGCGWRILENGKDEWAGKAFVGIGLSVGDRRIRGVEF